MTDHFKVGDDVYLSEATHPFEYGSPLKARAAIAKARNQ